MSKRYEWSQDTETVHISFKIDPDCKSKNIRYKIINKNINILYNDETILDGEMYDWIKTGSDYFLINEDTVDFYIDKLYSKWWEYLIKGTEVVEEPQSVEGDGYLGPEMQGFLDKMIAEAPERPEKE